MKVSAPKPLSIPSPTILESSGDGMYEYSFAIGDIGSIRGQIIGWFNGYAFVHNVKGLKYYLKHFTPRQLIDIEIVENVPSFTTYLAKYQNKIIN
jgi:hypothetical protein